VNSGLILKADTEAELAGVMAHEIAHVVLHDAKRFFEQVLIPDQYCRHNDPDYSDCERKNADSHMRAMLMGQTLCLQVAKCYRRSWHVAEHHLCGV
jgi:thiamine phosphate synthase YjbQ (UPF0047 family)